MNTRDNRTTQSNRARHNRRRPRWDRIFFALAILVGLIVLIVMAIHHSNKRSTEASSPEPTTEFSDIEQSNPPELSETAVMSTDKKTAYNLLAGADISKHNGEIVTDGDFVIVKATEGVGYVDPRFYENIDNAIENGQLCGVYHFARPDTNMPAVEAEHFVETIRPYLGKVVLVLDWEVEGTVDNTLWASAWMWQVYQMTGVRPILYTSASVAANYDWTGISSQFDLWVACYVQDTADIPKQAIDNSKYDLSDWNTVIWQYSTAGELDRNVSSLTTEQWSERCTATTERLESKDLMLALGYHN